MRSKCTFGPFAAALLTTTIGLALFATVVARAADRVVLPGHVLPALSESDRVSFVPKAADANEEQLTLTLVLRRHDQEGFERFLADVYNPASPQFRRFVSAAELSDRFGPSPHAYALVRDHLVGQGFSVTEGSTNRMTLSVTGTRALAERALAVTIVDRKAGDTRFHANLDEPSLPAHVAEHVEAIVGLSTLARPRSVGLISWFKKQPCKEAGDNAGYPLQLSRGDAEGACRTAVGTCSTRQALNAAEHADVLKVCDKFKKASDPFVRWAAKDPPAPTPWKNVTGAGQKVGIVGFDSFVASDVRDFLDLFGVPDSTFAALSHVQLNGGAALGPEQTEVLLDIQTVLINAPDAQVVVYDAPFTGGGSFQGLFNRAIADGVTIISNSWTYCEAQTSASDALSIDSILATAAAAGISVFNAAGDTGSTCLGFAPNSIGVPSGSPNATAVGGTTLIAGPDNIYGSETWWNGIAATPPTGQGGFGTSRFFARPAYQAGLNASPMRSIPDVAFNADPSRGTIICQASLGGCPAPVLIGGTSMSAPAWAAATALMNQAVGRNLGLLNPQIYPLAATDAFHSSASMGSDFVHVGLGSPNLNRLQLALRGSVAGPVSAAQSRVRAVNNTVSAEGTSSTAIVVRLRDADGNMVSGKTVTLAASPGSNATITPASGVSSTSNGAVVFTVKNASVQEVTFTATDVTDGIVITTTPVVSFVVPPVAAGGISAFPTTVQNNGVASTTITITLQDALGNPTPDKAVALSQGGGHSIITAPTPAVTNVSGQIQFTATNKTAETVTYTAVVATDGDVPVPGSAVVTFSGQASTPCVGAITAAPGYAVTPFATGFLAESFSFSNVNWGGCPGGSDPTFGPDGSFYVSNFRTGELFNLPAQGGASSTANRLSTPGLALTRSVFGKDGKLYAARSGTGAGLFSGAILELDPSTGATLRTLASNLPCVTPPAVDPISGDLFFTGQCFGSGGDDARLLRIGNPGSATPVLSTYATLPGAPNGVATFAPDGTIFVAIRYAAPAPQPEVVRVSGTNQAQPPTITPTGVNGVFWVNVGEVLPNGAAKSLIVNTSDQKLKLVDISVTPPTSTEILTTGASSGVVGPDACLYISNGETIYRLTTAAGSCGFAPTSVGPAMSLTPTVVTPDPAQGTQTTLIARLIGVPNLADVPIMFRIDGENRRFQMVRTDTNGVAAFTYTGQFTGSDTVVADTYPSPNAIRSNTARITWSAGKHISFTSLNLSPSGSFVGAPVSVSAAAVDVSVDPQLPVAGLTLAFNVAGQACNAVTNASGIASCQVTVPLTGNYTLTVSFAGNASFLASTDAIGFTTLPPGPPPCFAFNDVDSTSQFCSNVEWMRNRAVTLGCTTTLYCPVDFVTRLQMAAFMNRLGTTLTGEVRSVALQTGALVLDATPVVCQTADLAPANFDRRIVVDASFSAFGAASFGFAADAVASLDGGATWVPLASVSNRGFVAASHWGHVRARGVADIDAADTVRFGLSIGRGGLAGAANPTDSTCKLRAIIGSR